MGTPTAKTDPRLIREVLTHLESHGAYITARHFNTDASNIYRWQQYRADRGPQWPTDEDIAQWDARAQIRARNAERWRRTARRAHFNAGPSLIDSTGTRRRLRALVANGHSQTRIGAELNVTGARISQLCRGENPLVFRETANAVSDLYDRWSMVIPTCNGSVVARAYARNQKWEPVLSWDDATIDDPNARPAGLEKTTYRHRDEIDEAAVIRAVGGERLTLTKAERAEVVRRLRAGRWPDRQIEMHTGIKADRYDETREEAAA